MDYGAINFLVPLRDERGRFKKSTFRLKHFVTLPPLSKSLDGLSVRITKKMIHYEIKAERAVVQAFT